MSSTTRGRYLAGSARGVEKQHWNCISAIIRAANYTRLQAKRCSDSGSDHLLAEQASLAAVLLVLSSCNTKLGITLHRFFTGHTSSQRASI